jgi:iron complex transport system permease protein
MSRTHNLNRRRTGVFAAAALLTAAAAAAALFSGRYPSAGISFGVLSSPDPLSLRIITHIRAPRIASALLIGAVLSASGFVFQMLFSNPLVEPGFLGVSQGAAFGAAAAILLFGNTAAAVQSGAFITALAGLSLSFLLASAFRFGGWILRLILAGIAVSALFSSGLGIIKYLADPQSQLQEITFWLLGGLWNTDWQSFLSILPLCGGSLTVMLLYRWRINILSLDDRSAYAAGISPVWEKRFLLICATAGTAAAVSVSGLVGWIGLIVPHISRRIVGADSQHALPLSMLIGSLYLLIGDTVGRTLLSGELPLGIITSITGATLFALFLSSRRSLGEAL